MSRTVLPFRLKGSKTGGGSAKAGSLPQCPISLTSEAQFVQFDARDPSGKRLTVRMKRHAAELLHAMLATVINEPERDCDFGDATLALDFTVHLPRGGEGDA